MKAKLITILVITAIAAALAQGPLTPPPGVPAPGMKTLAELWDKTGGVEQQAADIAAKTAAINAKTQTVQTLIGYVPADVSVGIADAPATINTRGVYYLKDDLRVTSGTAITITADNVTLDLRGFSIRSTASPAGGAAIHISGARKNIRIKNGTLRGATTVSGATFSGGGFDHGIAGATAGCRNLVVADVRVHGVAGDGIFLTTGANSIIQNCQTAVCGGRGLVAAIVRGSQAENCGDEAIVGSVVSDSRGESVGSGASDAGISSSVAARCLGVASAGSGIQVTGNVSDSEGRSASGSGIYSEGNVAHCFALSSSGPGIFQLSDGNIIGSRGTSTTGVGIGIFGNVADSFGRSQTSIGLNVLGNVTNSTGLRFSSTGRALFAEGTASNCFANHMGSPPVVAIEAAIAIGCRTAAGTIASPEKHLGTP